MKKNISLTLAIIWGLFPFMIAYGLGAGFKHEWYVLPLLLFNAGLQLFAHKIRTKN